MPVLFADGALPCLSVRNGYLAIDLTPSRLAAGILDADGEIMVRDRVATPARNVWPTLTQLVRRVLAANPSDVRPRSVGVTSPGPIDRMTGAMKPVGMPMWHDFPVRRELAEITGLPVSVDTAGRALALAELWCGDAADLPPRRQHFATLVLGDSVDGGFVDNGRLVEGLTGNVGQFGHLIVEPEGAPCPCGAVGCLNAYAAVQSIEAGTGRELRRTPPAITERTGIMTARACATLAALLDVTDIVIGGAVPSVLGPLFFDALAKEFDQRCGLEHLADIRIRGVSNSRLGPLLAAAAVARRDAAEWGDDESDDADRVVPEATPTAGVAPTELAAEAVAGPRVRLSPAAVRDDGVAGASSPDAPDPADP
jgi:glucokinase